MRERKMPTLPAQNPATHSVKELSFNLRLEYCATTEDAYVYSGENYIGRVRLSSDRKGQPKLKYRSSSSPFSNTVRLNFGSSFFHKTKIAPTEDMIDLLSDNHVVNAIFRTVLHDCLYTDHNTPEVFLRRITRPVAA
jgi:hypothetical protein